MSFELAGRWVSVRHFVTMLQLLFLALGSVGCVAGHAPDTFTTASIPKSDGLRGPIDAAAVADTLKSDTPEEQANPGSRVTFFNSVAFPFSSAVQGDSWRRVRDRGTTRYFAACVAERLCANQTARAAVMLLEQADGQDAVSQISLVNSGINDLVRYVPDQQLYGTSDYWADLDQTLLVGAGDCEDLAIAKMQLLQQLGFESADLHLVLLKDERRKVFHAVLVVQVNGSNFVLDSITDAVRHDGEIKDYLPLVSFNSDRSWIYGSRSATGYTGT